MKSIAVFSDVHLPYHDSDAVELLVEVLADQKPDIVVANGDIFDFYSVSSHRKDPRRPLLLEDELMEAMTIWAAIDDACGDAEKHFLMGNHEDRLSRYLQDRAPALMGLGGLSAEELFSLDDAGWNVVPYKDYLDIGRITYTHDLSNTGPHCAEYALRDAGHSIVIGHAHRIRSAVSGDINATPRVAHCFGWLGNAWKADYMHTLKARRDWALGFGFGWMDDEGSTWFQAVPIIGRKCIVGGKEYSI